MVHGQYFCMCCRGSCTRTPHVLNVSVFVCDITLVYLIVSAFFLLNWRHTFFFSATVCDAMTYRMVVSNWRGAYRHLLCATPFFKLALLLHIMHLCFVSTCARCANKIAIGKICSIPTVVVLEQGWVLCRAWWVGGYNLAEFG